MKETPPKAREPSKEQRAQAVEAEKRREALGEKYQITPEEKKLYLEKVAHSIESLSEDADPIDVAISLDRVFGDTPRDRELKGLLLESLAGKISESIRHYMKPDAQNDFAELLTESEDVARKYPTFQVFEAELEKYEPLLAKYGLNRREISRKFIQELKGYLGQSL